MQYICLLHLLCTQIRSSEFKPNIKRVKTRRYKTFLTSNIILFVTGIATPFCTDFVSFAIIRFLMGLTYNTFFASFYLLGKVTLTWLTIMF